MLFTKAKRDLLLQRDADQRARIAELENVVASNLELFAKLEQRAVLISVETEGRVMRLRFARNSEIHTLEVVRTMDVDVPALRKMLLE